MSGKRAKRKRKATGKKNIVAVRGCLARETEDSIEVNPYGCTGGGFLFETEDRPVANILELAMAAPNEKADAEFIELALADLLSDIAYVEARHGVVLVGDRADFDRARKDWLWFTRVQVAHAVSVWRSGIFKRYMHH